MLNWTEQHDNKEQGTTQQPTENNTKTTSLERFVKKLPGLKYIYCRQIFILGPDVILNTLDKHINARLALSKHHEPNLCIMKVTHENQIYHTDETKMKTCG